MLRLLPLLLVTAIAAAYAVREWRRRKRVRARRGRGDRWSIGFQQSRSPFAWDPRAAQLLDRSRIEPGRDVFGTADPFLIAHHGRVFAFFERIFTDEQGRAQIAVATLDPESRAWTFLGTALDEPFHLSYPHVFAHGGDLFLVPESKAARSVRLYRAVDFPLRWQFETELIRDRKLVDPSLVFHGGTWFLFASRRRTLYLFTAPELRGPWTPHPRSPVRRGNYARNAGRIIEIDGQWFRLAQEQRGYGGGVHAFQIVALTPTAYAEIPFEDNPILAPGAASWCRLGMHHLDVLKRGDQDYLGVYDGEGIADENAANRKP